MSRVHIAPCPDYDPARVEDALHASLEAFPEAPALIRAGQKVLLKANLLQPQPPDKAVTTHPALVAAVARWVTGLGATPIIADSPGGLFNVRTLRHLYQVTGMAQAATDGGAELNYDVSALQVAVPEGRATHTLDAMRAAVEADAIICLPKLKTHGLTLVTGAVKNLFGTVPGLTKGAYHARFPTVDRFSAMLIDNWLYYKPVLTVMDAVVGMQGNGPSGGDPCPIGLLLTSTDGIALDVVAAAVLGVAPLSVPTVAAAARRGLTSGRVEDVQVLGAHLDSVRVRGFRLPHTGMAHGRVIPAIVPRWVTDQLLASPQAGERCTACGVCEQNCPVHAIEIVDGRARTDLRRCIHCFCCHELCPENAVQLRMPLLAKLLDRL